MPVDSRAFESAAAVQMQFEDHYGDVSGLLGVGLCLNAAADGPAIHVQVASSDALSALPRTFHGLDVVADIVGRVDAY